MKNTKKILAVALICTVPLGLFAYDKYEKHNNHNKYDNNRTYYDNEHNCEDDDFNIFSNDYMLKKGVNFIFEGRLEEKPKSGFNGVWKISNMNVLIDDKTAIYIDKNISIGDEINVLAKREAGKITAIQIEHD